MSTSGGGILNAICYVLMLFVALSAARPVVAGVSTPLRRIPLSAVVLWLVVAIPSLVELGYHGIFDALSRQPDLIRTGQVWRLITSAVVQDGGIVGTLFNLVILGPVALIALSLWGGMRGWAIFLVGAIGFDLLVTFVWPNPGGGNSAATFTLTTSMLGLLIVRRRTQRVLLSAAAVVVIGIVLLALSDAHGLPVLGGLVLGVLLAGTLPTVPVHRLSEQRRVEAAA